MCAYDDFTNDDSSTSDKSDTCDCSSFGNRCCCRSKCDHRCSRFLSHYRGPLIVIAVGLGFMAVGAIPVAVATATHTKNSALIIGAGFVGFGLLIFLPGLSWCIIQRLMSSSCCIYCLARRQRAVGRPPVDMAEEEDCACADAAPFRNSVVHEVDSDRNQPSLKDVQRDSLLRTQESITVDGVHDNDHCNHDDDDDDDDEEDVNVNGSGDVIINVGSPSAEEEDPTLKV